MTAAASSIIDLGAAAQSDCDGLLASGVTAQAVFEAARDSRQWVHRRVLSVRLREDGCTYMRTSLDLTLPKPLLGTSRGEGLPQVVVPITWMRKRADTHRLDFRGPSGETVPLVHSQQQAALLVAVMCSMARKTGRKTITLAAYDRILDLTSTLVVERNHRRANRLVGAIMREWRGEILDEALLGRILQLVEFFVDHFLVAVVVAVAPARGRMILKYNFGHGQARPILVPRGVAPWRTVATEAPQDRTEGWLKTALTNLSAQLRRAGATWKATMAYVGVRMRLVGPRWRAYTWVVYDDPDLRLAKSTHFEFEVTGGVLIRRLALAGPGIRPCIVQDRTRSVARIEVRAKDVPEIAASDFHLVVPDYFAVLVVPRKSSLTNFARRGPALVTFVVAYLAVLSAIAFDATVLNRAGLLPAGGFRDAAQWLNGHFVGADASTVIPLTTALISASAFIVGRSLEHGITTHVLRPFRWVAFGTGLTMGVVAVLIAPTRFEYWWFVMVPVLMVQVFLLGRARTIAHHVVRRGEDVLAIGPEPDSVDEKMLLRLTTEIPDSIAMMRSV